MAIHEPAPAVARARVVRPAVARPTGRTVPPVELQRRVRRAIEREGVAGAARIIGLSTHGLLSVAAGALCNRGTITQAEVNCPR